MFTLLRSLIALVVLTVAPVAFAQSCPCSIWGASATPLLVDSGDATPGEFGVKFRADASGFVTGVRFYKGAANTGTHIGNLWTTNGTLLATATFTGETSTGWQQVTFSSPVAITAGTTYIVSYFAPAGHYAYNSNFFTAGGVDTTPLHALGDGVDGPNGVFSYGAASGFPSNTYNGGNYWVDVVFSATGQSQGPSVTSFSPSNGLSAVNRSTAVTATFNQAVDPTSVSASTFQLLDDANNAVSATVTYNSATFTATLQPAIPLLPSSNYTAVVVGGTADPRIKSAAGNPMTASVSWSFATAGLPGSCPCTIWDSAVAPPVPDSGDSSAGEFGVRFRSDVNGFITGLRFYKSAANGGTHTGSVWSNTGNLLGTAVFTGEGNSGWQQVTFSAPIPVTANTTYVASYYSAQGHYSYSPNFFTTNGVDNGPLHALADQVDGANGVFALGAASTFPTATFGSANYWVDVVFNTSPTTNPPAVVSFSPANGATDISTATAITATFNGALDPSSVNASAFQLRGPGGAAVAASLSYDANTFTVSLQPAGGLAASSAYTAVLVGGGIRSASGAPLPASVTWSFVTGSSAQPLIVLYFSPGNGATGVSTATAVSATFNRDLNPATLSSAGFQLLDPSNAPVNATISYNSATRTVTLQPVSGLAGTTLFRPLVVAGIIKDTSGAALSANVAWSFTTGAAPLPPPQCPCSIWTDNNVPVVTDSGDNSSVELGVKFRADINGLITGIRFYKAAANTGTHIGSLWTSTGALLSSATFTGESGSGWQQVTFSSPVAITAGTTYVASYFAPNGHYAFDQAAFTSGLDRSPLHFLANGLDGLNGVYKYAGSSAFPNDSYNSSNYWVDVVFVTANFTSAPTIISRTPAAGATGVNIGSNISATFSVPMNAATINSAAFQLVDSSNNVIAGTATYVGATASLIFTPTIPLLSQTTYTATIRGTATDVFGNALGADVNWTFTTSTPPASTGPGGPILVISSAQNPFTRYYSEILLNEGLNEFLMQDISLVTATTLASYDIVILGEMQLTPEKVTMLTTWVNGGGRLIAMRPDKQLSSLLGLTATPNVLANGYLAANTATGPGVGIVSDTIQFHGTADLYTANGATAYATLYSNATTATASPALTWRSVGAGEAAAFTYDLARSVVLTRQGNPAWSGEDRDAVIDPSIGNKQIRSNDLFFGNASFDPQPDWIDFNKVAIPQADEQQRLLANLILRMNAARKPLPRFWYLPSGFKAAVIMTGDDHNNGGTAGRFDNYINASPAGCSVNDWTCIRATSYIFPNTPIPNYLSYASQGFEIAVHADNNPTCTTFTPASLEASVSSQLSQIAQNYPGLAVSKTNRTHCVLWSDYDTAPQILLNHGIRLDTSYYYWPSEWIQNRPGMFTGSGMPMRYADRNGNIMDVFQATTQMPDESLQTFPLTIDTLLDNAIGPKGFYGVFTANMHTDLIASAGSDAIIASALARGVPVVSALQMLNWLDGRNSSSFGALSWTGNTLTFSVTAASGARNLKAMLPLNSGAATLRTLTVNGTAVTFTRETIKGVMYATFNAVSGSYVATFAPAFTISGTISGAGGSSATVALSGAATATTVADAAGNYSFANVFAGSFTVTPAKSGYVFSPASANVTISSANATAVNFTSSIATSTTIATDVTVHTDNPSPANSITSPVFGTTLGNELLLAFVGASNPGTGTNTTVTSITGGGLTWQLVQRTNVQVGTAEIWRAFASAPLSNVTVTAVLSTTAFQSSMTVMAFSGADITGVNGAGAIGATGSGNALVGAPTASLVTTRDNSWVIGVGFDWDESTARVPGPNQSLVHQYLAPLSETFWVQRQNSPIPAAGTTVIINDTAPDTNRYNLSIVEIRTIQPTYSIAGTITGAGAANTTVTLSGAAAASTTSDAAGNYSFTTLSNGSYTVTPSRSGFTFTPASRSVTISSANASGVNFSSTGIPIVSLSPTALSFGNQLVNATSTAQTVTLSNTGGSTLTISGITISGTNSSNFARTTTCGSTLAAASSCNINVTFTPSTTGTRVATLTITDNASGSPHTVSLTGTGANPAAALSPTTLAFGTQAVNTTSPGQVVTLTNTGGVDLAVNSITITGTNATNYARTTTCGSTVAAGANCTISVTFTPSATGNRTATLTISDNAPGSPHTVALSGTGSGVSVSPGAVVFGNQNLNTTSGAQVVTLRNVGTGTLTSITTSLTGGNTGDFTRTTTCGSSLASGASCTINITFTPTVVGTRSTTLRITNSDVTSPQNITVTGTGAGAVASLSTASIAFGLQVVNTTSNPSVVTLTNTGNVAMTINSISLTGTNASNFAQTNTCGTSVAAGANCTISITFTPTAAAARSATLSISDSAAGSPHTVALSGSGTGVSLAPASLTFASRQILSTSPTQTVTLRNFGTTTLTGIVISFVGGSTGDFTLQTNCGGTLAAGASCSINVAFRPIFIGTRSTTLRVANSDPASPFQTTLTGTGTF